MLHCGITYILNVIKYISSTVCNYLLILKEVHNMTMFIHLNKISIKLWRTVELALSGHPICQHKMAIKSK